jgi:uncharacterized protein
MQDLMLIAGVFLGAGFVKGVIGLGLPTISMGLLVLFMPAPQAAALLIVPSLVTNIWQMVAGRSLTLLLRRLWPMMAGMCLGTWAGAGLMTGAHGKHGVALLGVCLMLYAITGTTTLTWSISAATERWLGPLSGAVTGLITAATGVFVIPAVPYLQAIGLEKDDLVQALGLSFTVSTLALAGNLVAAGLLDQIFASTSIATLAMAGAGMWLGQALRSQLKPAAFRFCFFAGLFALGLYVTVRSIA